MISDPTGSRTVESRPTMRSFVRAIARVILWPVRRFFDPRFAGITDHVDFHAKHALEVAGDESARIRAEIERVCAQAEGISAAVAQSQRVLEGVDTHVRAETDMHTEATSLIGQSLSDLNTSSQHIRKQLHGLAHVETATDEIRQELDALAPLVRGMHEFHALRDAPDIREASINDINARIAHLLNYASSYRGFAAQAHLWFNHPVLVSYAPEKVYLAHVNERVTEMPYVFQALSSLEPGAKILDVGAAESVISLSLASLGYRVTALDPRPIPLEHPLLEVVSGSIEEFDRSDSFDAIICISTLEHIGLPAYGRHRLDEDADARALERMSLFTREGGVLVLTVPYGAKQINEHERTYDRADLDRLLESWETLDLTYVERQDATTWIRVAEPETPDDGRDRVAMVTAARRP
jgi:2-polyprenyl-3-methyl-5-hydroxy-6-metoxy-1,4-benzoquinol methylase